MLLAGTVPVLAADSSAGKALFDSHCAVCHTKTGAGGLKVGSAVSADLRLPGLENAYHHNDALILRAILQGKDEEGGPLDMVMPHWKGELTAAQATEILSYVKTLCCNPAPESEGKGE